MAISTTTLLENYLEIIMLLHLSYISYSVSKFL